MGRQTDRGYMYIVLGPPDEIDSHPGNKSYPFEEWMYRHVEGTGDNVAVKFVDRAGTGDYQLVPPRWKWPLRGN